MINNFFRCDNCQYFGIAEEKQDHVCRRKVLDYKIKQNVLWVYDGNEWYPRKLLSAEKLQQDNSNLSADKDTEPFFGFCKVYGG